jgi:hypothetical protein
VILINLGLLAILLEYITIANFYNNLDYSGRNPCEIDLNYVALRESIKM